MNWDQTDAEGYEEKRPLTSTNDVFEPPFDESQIGGDEYATWEATVRNDFE